MLDSWGYGYLSDVALGIRWCADNVPAPAVINLSLGCACYSRVVDEAVQYAYEERGDLVVAAAGNGGCDDCIGFPAALPDVIPVTCVGLRQTVCSFSSTGPEAELAAPGLDILSTLPTCSSWAPLCNDSGYGTLSGTSMSSPHVAGVAALVWAREPALSNAQLRALLHATAQDVGPAGRDDGFGYGIVDAACALAADAACPVRPLPPPLPPPTLCENPGPDLAGYVCTVGAPAFEDISATGTSLGLTQASTAPLALAAPFPFYTGPRNQAWVSSNGFVTFTEPYSPDLFDNSDLVTAALTPVWSGGDELVPDHPGASVVAQTLGSGDEQRTIVQWTHVPYASRPDTNVTFQFVLHADGRIDINFLDAPGGVDRYVGLVGPGFGSWLFYRTGDFDQPPSTVLFDRLTTDVALAMTASPTKVPVGQTVDLTLTVTNLDGDDASGEFIAQIPAGLQFQDFGPFSGLIVDVCFMSWDGNSTTFGCGFSGLPAGESWNATVVLLATTPGAWPVGAFVQGTGDVNPANDRAKLAIQVTPLVADLVLTQSIPGTIGVGEEAVATLTLTNLGPDAASHVVLRDQPGRGLHVLWADGLCDDNATAGLACEVGDLLPGETAILHVGLTGLKAGSARNVASVTSSSSDPQPRNNKATAATRVVLHPTDLALAVAALPAEIPLGQPIDVDVSLANLGATVAPRSAVRIMLPAGLVLDSADDGCTLAGRTLRCFAGDLQGGDSMAFQFTLNATRLGGKMVRLAATSDARDPSPLDNRATLSWTATAAAAA